VGTLTADTAVSGDGGKYEATLSADWTVWNVNGGYIASVLLRACGAEASLPRPASLSCHFLGPPRPGPVTVEVQSLGGGRSAQSLAAQVTQDGRPIAHGLVWMVDDSLTGLQHDVAEMPAVPAPAQLRSSREMLDDEQWAARPPIWSNFEERPIDWPDDWADPSPKSPRTLSWLRFAPPAPYDDPLVDAARVLVPLDLFPPSSAFRAYRNAERTHLPMSLDLSVTFHRPSRTAPWLLVDSSAPVAAGGLVGGQASVWSEGGELLATSTAQLLCRSVGKAG
jgi:acyl-CoA thioesterase